MLNRLTEGVKSKQTTMISKDPLLTEVPYTKET